MEVCTVGGYEEVGKNMTAVKVDEDVFIFDIGIYIPGIVELQEEHFSRFTHRFRKKGGKNTGQENRHSEKDLRNFGAIPDDRVLDRIGWRGKVRAIFVSHAHFDHVAGIPYLAGRYPKATIYGTPFTMKFLQALMKDDRIKIPNKIKIVNPDSTHTLKGKSGSYKFDFIRATHSTLQCAFPVLHTKEGAFFYALDLKFDNYPTFGKPPSYEKIKTAGKKGVKVAVIDALYSETEKKPGGERIAQHMLKDAFSRLKGKDSAYFLTTFSGHIERLINAVKLAKKTGREIVFMGRSLAKNIETASKIGMWPFKRMKVLKYGRQRESFFKKLQKNRGKYFVFCTGHQAEENSVLDRIVKETMPFKFKDGDNIIFSSSVIPVSTNISARKKMDKRFRSTGVKIQTDVHVHGHGSREDMRDLLELIKPKHVIPAHGTLEQEKPFIDLAREYGYRREKTSHMASNGRVIKF